MEEFGNDGVYGGLRVSMTRQAGITITKHKFPQDVYLSFQLNPDPGFCFSNSTEKSTIAPKKAITIRLEKLVSVQQRGVTFFAYTLGIIFAVAIIVGIVSAVIIHLTNKVNDDVNLLSVAEAEDDPLIDSVVDVKNFCSVASAERNKQSRHFAVQLFTIAVFYVMPVARIVYTAMQTMIETGNEDLCYYNSLCTVSFFSLRSFNHVFSNVGYIILGITHIAIVYFKEVRFNKKSKQNPQHAAEHGIPVCFGFSYAMGIGMCVQGVFSALYHICPTRDSFEFDTAFMYILATICMLHLYHARNTQCSVKAESMYVVIGVVVLHTALTFLHDVAYFKLYFILFHLLGCNVVATEFYYNGDVKWSLNARKIVEFLKMFWRSGPLRVDRLAVVVLGNIANITLSCIQWLSTTLDFNTYILLIFVVNLLLYSIYYISLKLRHKESLLQPSYPVVYFILSISMWIAALYTFSLRLTSWEGTAAESRVHNDHCLIAGIYDTHDMWHFLSALGLFFFFQFLLFLDDDLVNVPQPEIALF